MLIPLKSYFKLIATVRGKLSRNKGYLSLKKVSCQVLADQWYDISNIIKFFSVY